MARAGYWNHNLHYQPIILGAGTSCGVTRCSGTSRLIGTIKSVAGRDFGLAVQRLMADGGRRIRRLRPGSAPGSGGQARRPTAGRSGRSSE
jgi:hypothetical protein